MMKIRHDCEMTFPDESHPMAWLFVCRCGFTTGDMWIALDHSRKVSWMTIREMFHKVMRCLLTNIGKGRNVSW